MKISLKKAAALAVAVSAIKVDIPHTLTVDPFGAVPTEKDIIPLKANFEVAMATSLQLVNTSSILRSLISVANEGRINALLGERAAIDKKLAILNSIPVRQRDTNLDALAAKMEAGKKAEQPAYGRSNPLTIELETVSSVGKVLKTLKKQRVKIEDELAHLNFTTMVEISEDMEKLLSSLDLI